MWNPTIFRKEIGFLYAYLVLSIYIVKQSMKMSIKPSEALMSLYRKDCREACSEYSYWWSVKAAMIAHVKWKLEDCISKCVREYVHDDLRTMNRNSNTTKLKPAIESKR